MSIDIEKSGGCKQLEGQFVNRFRKIMFSSIWCTRHSQGDKSDHNEVGTNSARFCR